MRAIPFSAQLLPAALIAVLAVAACSSEGLKRNPTPPNFQGVGSGSAGDAATTRYGGDDSGTIFGIGKGAKKDDAGGGSGIGVNAFLWRGALDTIAFMPLASADPFGGVMPRRFFRLAEATAYQVRTVANTKLCPWESRVMLPAGPPAEVATPPVAKSKPPW